MAKPNRVYSRSCGECKRALGNSVPGESRVVALGRLAGGRSAAGPLAGLAYSACWPPRRFSSGRPGSAISWLGRTPFLSYGRSHKLTAAFSFAEGSWRTSRMTIRREVGCGAKGGRPAGQGGELDAAELAVLVLGTAADVPSEVVKGAAVLVELTAGNQPGCGFAAVAAQGIVDVLDYRSEHPVGALLMVQGGGWCGSGARLGRS